MLRALLAGGHDPNGRDAQGRTPLMRFRSAEANRVLIEAGADVNAVDKQGRTVLEHQAGVTMARVGYSAPLFDALDVLIEAGARPPTVEQGKRWVEEAFSQVCAALEHNEACAFQRWVERVASG